MLRVLAVDAQRVEFADFQPRPLYLETYRRIDLCLDTFPYNGHTTSLDSFWMGVPVVSLCGRIAVSRAGLSQATNLGLPGLVAESPEAFVQTAVAWARDLPRLSQLRQGLRGRMTASPLMDGPRFARHVEDAYSAMWREYCERRASPGPESGG